MEIKKIIVFGSFVTDLTARSPRFPREGETVMGSSFRSGPGGKGSNQAVAAKRAGADVSFITRLGDDIFGRAALDFYHSEDMDTSAVIIDSEYATGAALIAVNEQTAQNQIVVVLGACDHFTDDELNDRRTLIASGDILLTQLETNMPATEKALRIAKESGLLTILNPAPAVPLSEEFLSLVDYITPNETEAGLLTGIEVVDQKSASQAASKLIEMGVKNVIITLGSQGYYACDGACEYIGSAVEDVKVVDSTGAGDAFNGGFAAALAAGMSFRDAVEYANVTGGLSVTRPGTAPAMPRKEEIDAVFCRRRNGGSHE